jgi:hypothetical protein
MTKFQAKLLSDRGTLWDIVKLFHPTMPDEVENFKGTKIVNIKEERLAAYSKYQWVVIEFRVRTYGLISIGITNVRNSTCYGSGITKQHMSDDIANGNVKFDAWRFSLDKLFNSVRDKSEQASEILISKGYKLIEVDEWYNYYYQD